jgi:hypothetical protein
MAAAASLAAGLFALPGRAAAGFRRGRCHAPPCCPLPEQSCHCCYSGSCLTTIDPMGLNVPYNAVTVSGSVDVTAYKYATLTVQLTLSLPSPWTSIGPISRPLKQDPQNPNHYTWDPYKFQNVPQPTDTSYNATVKAQAYSDGTPCGDLTPLPIEITKM